MGGKFFSGGYVVGPKVFLVGSKSAIFLSEFFNFFFFVIVYVIIDITQKAFVIPCFKRGQKLDLLRCIKKVSNLLAKMVTYSKKFCGSVMIIGHYYNVIHLFVLKVH